jgi:hypothetical protein
MPRKRGRKEVRVETQTPYSAARVRLERISDGAVRWGWLPNLEGEEMRVLVDEPLDDLPGERFVLQILDGPLLSMAQVVLVEAQDREAHLKTLNDVRLASPMEAPRASVGTLRGVVRIGDQQAIGEVLDASSRGAGLMLPIHVPEGARVTIEVGTDFGRVQLSGEARYCRSCPENAGRFRVGIMLDESAQETAAQWAQVIRSAARGRPAA